MKIHILACGGAVMHNMAIALHQLGHTISGSDDEIFEPALSRLKSHGILPESFGWHPEKITKALDFIILGMHAKADNPELEKAKSLGIKVYSFPEYVYEHAKNKIRVVIAGSHGKTSTTAMIMHVLKTLHKDFDYLVGSQLEGFDTMVKFSDAPIMVIEGDEYLTSALDRVPKFIKYKPHYTQITGIAWDHINVFPTFENYVDQFAQYIDTIEKDGELVYFNDDKVLKALCEKAQVKARAYDTPKYENNNGVVTVLKDRAYPLAVFGEHNLQNMEGASLLCENINITQTEFYQAMASFTGSARRLEKVFENDHLLIFRDFAHSPSKLKATVEAVRQQYPDSELMAVFELHTFSSLSQDFLPHYQDTMELADKAIVYFNPLVFEHKKMPILTLDQVTKGFHSDIEAINNTSELIAKINNFKGNVSGQHRVLLLMSSGNFDNTQLW
ncbi:MAG: Mur ligase family protein [bacterium]|nr:Mur ligase family protein [bacterium]